MTGAIAVVAAAAITISGTAMSQEQPLTVSLDTGDIHGSETEKARTFSGIPFAAPPVDQLRWQAPQPVEPWSDVRDATKPGDACPQEVPDAEPMTNEDCLYLNVTTPKEPSAEPLPVMVWLHGGGFTTGSGDQYEAERLAEQGDVIVVTANYRLGVFGYFGHPGLAGSGDFGLADQMAALEWTQRNADAFGGDTGNVTVAGESAGAMSGCALLTSPAAEGLFDKAILSSGSCMLDWPTGVMFPEAPAATPYADVAETEAKGTAMATDFECDQADDPVACLRDAPAEELVERNQEFANNLSYGTELLPQDPAEAVRDGNVHQVPVISGGNHDEMRSFIGGVIMATGPITQERYGELMASSFGEAAEAVTAQYPLADYETPALAWATVTTDVSWSCPTLEADRLMAAAGNPVYAYEFNDPNAPNVNQIELPELPQGAAHATDLPYLFELVGTDLLDTPEKQALGQQMVGYWTAFMHSGEPNVDGSPSWPVFDERETVVGLVPEPDTGLPVDYAADHRCGFWQDLA